MVISSRPVRTQSTIPAKAGIHLSAVRAAEAWAPAFAGVDVVGSRTRPFREILDYLRYHFRLLNLRVMARRGDRREGRALQPLGQVRAVGRLDDAVLFAPDHETGHRHAVQPMPQARVVHEGPPAVEHR